MREPHTVGPDAGAPAGAVPAGPQGPGRSTATRAAIAFAAALLGFLLVVQGTGGGGLGERLEAEREEDLARILADLSTQSDRLQSEIARLRLKLQAFRSSAAQERLALRSLRERLATLQVLAGTVAVRGQGIRVTVRDPYGRVTQDQLVDAVQELRDAGAEAIAVSGVRLVASSAFTTRDDRLFVDGRALSPPYRIKAVGSAATMASAMDIPGGAVDTLESRPRVDALVERLAEVVIPARRRPQRFVYGTPVEPGSE
ncbi:MAG: DUF881 domain-containing protein [Actinomycetota bacterium]|nr:DUF881 domain-containing protein [Actinomycetota bacterium]